MALLVHDCPRCGSKSITFDVLAQVYSHTEWNWQNWYEIFCVCRSCKHPTIFVVGLEHIQHKDQFYKSNGLVSFSADLNQFFRVKGFINLRDNAQQKPPAHLPKDIENAFVEGVGCFSIGCNNAAATMFRLCVDLVTRPLLPDPTDTTKPQPPNNRVRRDLGLRLTWMFDNGILPPALRELAKCIREDGNDGAHVGNLTHEDAEDLLDFTMAILERLITEPKKLELAEARRLARRSS